MEYYKNIALDLIIEKGHHCAIEENWRPIKGYKGKYECSTMGRIKSVAGFGRSKYDQILKQFQNEHGYLQIRLFYASRKATTHKIHRLIAQTFIRNPKGKRTVNHKNSNKKDNRITNLEWATHSENHKHAYSNGRVRTMLGKTGRLNAASKPVGQYDINGNKIANYENARHAAREANISYKHISCVCNGKRKTCGGFVWKFLN